jgi:pimeloyl-ACP methyl ester carboxylesterase
MIPVIYIIAVLYIRAITLVSQFQEYSPMDVEDQARAALEMFMTPRRPAPRDWEAALLQQGTPLTLANGLAARSFGAGPRVLLVHGWEGRGMNLGMFITPLTAAGYQVIALDGPAHGESPGEQTHPPHFAQAILGVGQELGPLAGVIAHSMGAASTALALQQGLVAERVVLIAGPSSLAGVLQRFAQMAQLPEPVAERFYQLVAERVGAPAEALDIAQVGATLTTSALIIHDPADTDVPFADAQVIAASWPAARLYVTEGLGHRRILRDRDVIAMAVSFITADVPSAALLGSIA